MESIILNLLNLTGEERAAFAVLAPQRFHPDGDGLTVEDWQSAQVILGNPPPECLRGSTALRWLHTRSAGVDPYTAPGVLPSEAALTCSTGAYGHSVSEHLFALLLALMKRLPSYRDQQNRALWRDLGPVKTLLGAQVLVVGTGDLGSSFARLCQTLGASTSGVRRDPAKPAAGIERMYGFEALDTLLPAADVVALTLPQTPGTVRLFDKARLLRMKGDAILLNGGRGSCVDGQALAEVLADGRLWGAGLDGTDPEPLPPEHPLWRQPRALITPHTAGGNHLADTERRIARIALDNLRRYLAGRYGIGALEMTSDELIDAVRPLDLPRKSAMELTALLREADLVKFAKATPEAARNEEAYQWAYYFVEETNPVEEQPSAEAEEPLDLTPKNDSHA